MNSVRTIRLLGASLAPAGVFLASLLAVPFALAADASAPNAAASSGTKDAAGFAGSQSCRECHPRFFDNWSSSHHGLSVQPYNADLVRTRLTPQAAPITSGKHSYQLRSDQPTLVEQGPDGEKSYPVQQALGGKNVLHFLTPLERGRLQLLPIAYDVRRNEWFDPASEVDRHFGRGRGLTTSWQGRAHTFSSACLSCHLSPVAQNYDTKNDSYESPWRGPGINCEVCHGPSAEHVRVAQAKPAEQALKDPKLVVPRTLSQDQATAMCGSCHARHTSLTGAFRPGERFFDHFDLTTLEHPDFHPDGRDRGENFTLGSWKLSPCLKSGRLDCIACHASNGRYKFREKPNAACLPCHEQHVKTVVAHSRHLADGPGAVCTACHMPTTTFGRARRTDHSMRAPAPAATLAFGSPNACSQCHQDKDTAWADRVVREWRPRDYQAPLLQRAGLVAAARKEDWSRLPEIVSYLTNPKREEIWAASLLRLLRQCPDKEKWPGVLACLNDPSPLVRAAAVEALGHQTPPFALSALLTASRDEYRLVRTRAAAALSALPLSDLRPEDRRAFDVATQEYLRALAVRPDDSDSHYSMGKFYLGRQEYARALEEFSASSRFGPGKIDPLVSRALAEAAVGQNTAAEGSLREALALDPDHSDANLSLGLLLVELRRLPEAERAMRTAVKSDPKSAAAAFNLSLLLAGDRVEEAITWCRQAITLRPDDPRYGYSLGVLLNKHGRVEEAVQVLEAVIKRNPSTSESYVLLVSIQEHRGKWMEAKAVCRRAMANPNLPEVDRTQFVHRERQILAR